MGSPSPRLLFVSTTSHYQLTSPHTHSHPAGLAFAAMISPRKRQRSYSATLENHTTPTQLIDSSQRHFPGFNHRMPASQKSPSLSRQKSGPSPAPSGRSLVNDPFATHFAQRQTTSPRSKSKLLGLCPGSGGRSGLDDWSGSAKRVS